MNEQVLKPSGTDSGKKPYGVSGITFERFVSEQNDECLSLKIINPVPHGKCFVRYLRTSIIHCTHLSDFRHVNNSWVYTRTSEVSMKYSIAFELTNDISSFPSGLHIIIHFRITECSAINWYIIWEPFRAWTIDHFAISDLVSSAFDWT